MVIQPFRSVSALSTDPKQLTQIPCMSDDQRFQELRWAALRPDRSADHLLSAMTWRVRTDV